ncbi:hypothetical protein [uncultured Propionibacterium sp.]|uniref:hypothetical protein n=1 Tax=uncultured Propionibacterium sp. TaxID=218066 RepID=UPI00292EBB0B|nr:hypothetical protein [uncultured Propionibacterium sp.]
MAGYFVRLQLKLAWRGLTATTGRIVASAIALVYVLGLLVGLCAGATALGSGEAAYVRGPALTLTMAVVTLGWPLLAVFGGDSSLLDPARFALMPRRGRELAPAMFAAALAGPGSVILTVVGLLVVLAWRTQALPVALAVLSLLLGLATCVLSVRVVLAGLGAVLRRRRVREALSVVLVLGILAAGIVIQLVPYDLTTDALPGPELLAGITTAGRIARWTPFGWCWSLAWDGQQGAWGPLVAHLLASLALIAVLARCWARLVERALVSPTAGSGDVVRVRGSRLDRLLPDGVMGALMGRELRYWRRDSRRFMQLLGLITVPFLMLVPALAGGERRMLVMMPLMCAVMTSTVSAWGLSYDGSALWIMALSQVPAGYDRAARSAVVALFSAPILLAGIVVALIWSGAGSAPGLVGLCVGPWLVALGAGVWVDAMWQQPMPPPDSGIFVRNTGSTATGFVGSMLAMGAPVICAAPLLVLFVLAGTGMPWLGWLGLALGLVVGAGVCRGGIALAGRRLDGHWPEILARVEERTA